jgi:hypothetical protein
MSHPFARLAPVSLALALALAGCWMGAPVGSAGEDPDDDDGDDDDTGGGITDPDTGGQGGWVLEELESPTTLDLSDVWGNAWYDAWAVGEDGVILHYDGDAWSLADTSAVPEKRTLHGVGGRSASEAFAVGDEWQVLIFDGTWWKPYYAPTPAGDPLPNLRRVCVSPDGHVWMVGDEESVLHLIQAPHVFGYTPGGPDLHGVHCLPGGDAYIVGHDHTAFASSLIRYLQISDWSVHEMEHDPIDNMYAVAGDLGFGTWAAGFVDGQGSDIYRLIDDGWEIWETSPHEILDLFADAELGLWAVGQTTDDDSRGVVQAWKDGAPIFEQIVPSTTRLRGVWVSPDGEPREIHAVGKGGTIVRISWQAW